jgi:hypothetical protein
MVIKLSDIVRVRGTKVRGRVTKIVPSFARSGRKTKIFEAKAISGKIKGKTFQAKRSDLFFP